MSNVPTIEASDADANECGYYERMNYLRLQRNEALAIATELEAENERLIDTLGDAWNVLNGMCGTPAEEMARKAMMGRIKKCFPDAKGGDR